MATLELKNVAKSFGPTKVIHGIDLSIANGEFIVFVGPSGCGKSTLLRMIAGLEPVSGGTISIDGAVVNDIPAAERGLAMVFQSYALYPHMSVRQNLSFGLENLKTPKPEIQRRVAEAARMLRMDNLLERRPGQLSGGQRQRVAIGRAVVREPNIFLFDEPLSNLDAELRVQMRIEIGNLHQRLGNTMIYVTHDQVEAMTMADRIAVLRDGQLEQFGRPLDLYNHPANIFVAGFIGSPRMNFLPAVFENGFNDGVKVRICGRYEVEVPVHAEHFSRGASMQLGIRPEHLTVCQSDEAGTVPAVVKFAEQLGSECYLHAELQTGETVTVRLPGQSSIKRGENIFILLGKPSQRHLFDAATGLVVAPFS